MSDLELRERVRQWFLAGAEREPTEEELDGLVRIAEGGLPFEITGATG